MYNSVYSVIQIGAQATSILYWRGTLPKDTGKSHGVRATLSAIINNKVARRISSQKRSQSALRFWQASPWPPGCQRRHGKNQQQGSPKNVKPNAHNLHCVLVSSSLTTPMPITARYLGEVLPEITDTSCGVYIILTAVISNKVARRISSRNAHNLHYVSASLSLTTRMLTTAR